MAVSVEGEFKEVFTNTDSNLIAITDDKLRNIISRHLSIASRQNDWVGLSGILITIVLSIITCKFSDILGITNSGVFLLAFFVLSAFLIAFFLFKSLCNRERTNTEKMLEDIKKNKF